MATYQVKNDQDVVVYEGTPTDIARVYNSNDEYIITCANKNTKFLRKFHIVKIKTKQEKKDICGYICKHLERYGNTVLLDDPSIYQEECEQRGFKFTYSRKVRDEYGLPLNDNFKKGKRNIDIYYILERVKDENKNI